MNETEKPEKPSYPHIDPRVEFKNVSYLRTLNANKLAALDHPIVIQVEDNPTATIIPFQQYLDWQKEVTEACAEVERMVAELNTPRLIVSRDMLDSHESPNESQIITTMTPVQLDTIDHSKPLSAQPTALCAHCGEIFGITEELNNVATLCNRCFAAGHRTGNCLICLRKEKVQI